MVEPYQKPRFLIMSPLQKLTTEHTKNAERLRFMNKRIIFGHWAHGRKIFTTLCSMKDKIILSLRDLRGLCGGRSPFCSEVNHALRR